MATICPYNNRKCTSCPHYRADPDGLRDGPVCWVAHDQLAASKRPDAVLKYMDPDGRLSTDELNRMVEDVGADKIELVNASTEHGVLMGIIRFDVCDCKLDFNVTDGSPYIQKVKEFVDTVTDTSEPVTTRIMDVRTKITF